MIRLSFASVAAAPLLMATAIGLASAQVPADEAAEQETPASQQSAPGWRASTRGQSPARPVKPGPATLTLRIYDGARGFGPVYDGRRELVGVDVTSALETCADGNTIVRALNIGGWQYTLDARCDDLSRGSRITVTQGATGVVVRREENLRQQSPGPTLIRCESSTWTCRAEAVAND